MFVVEVKLNTRLFLLLGVWLLLGIVGRIIPHLPNMTPLTSLCLLSSGVFGRRLAFFFILATLALSDIFLATIFHYAAFGAWSWFTYTGFVGVVLLGFMLPGLALPFEWSMTKLVGFTMSASVLFWWWTNLGVWLSSGLYSHTIAGLLACYAFALPFLSNAVLGDLGWMALLCGLCATVEFPVSRGGRKGGTQRSRSCAALQRFRSTHQ